MGGMRKLIGIVVSAAFAVGCGGTVMTCPRVQTPVLLGPVERIGDAPRATHARGRKLEAHAEVSLQIAHGAGGTYASGSRSPRWAGSAPVWMARLHRDRDVHVTSARAGGFVWDAAGFFWMDNEVNLDMTVTKAGGK